MVDGDGALGDSEPETDAAGGCVARTIHAKERLKDFGEGVFGDARAEVADRDMGAAVLRLGCDIDHGVRRRVADGVADDIFKRAAEQFAISGDGGGAGAEHNTALLGIGFHADIAFDFAEQIFEIDPLAHLRFRIAFDAGHFNERADQAR